MYSSSGCSMRDVSQSKNMRCQEWCQCRGACRCKCHNIAIWIREPHGCKNLQHLVPCRATFCRLSVQYEPWIEEFHGVCSLVHTSCIACFTKYNFKTITCPLLESVPSYKNVQSRIQTRVATIGGKCACRESNPGHKHGRLVWCRYTTCAWLGSETNLFTRYILLYVKLQQRLILTSCWMLSAGKSILLALMRGSHTHWYSDRWETLARPLLFVWVCLAWIGLWCFNLLWIQAGVASSILFFGRASAMRTMATEDNRHAAVC